MPAYSLEVKRSAAARGSEASASQGTEAIGDLLRLELMGAPETKALPKKEYTLRNTWNWKNAWLEKERRLPMGSCRSTSM